MKVTFLWDYLCPFQPTPTMSLPKQNPPKYSEMWRWDILLQLSHPLNKYGRCQKMHLVHSVHTPDFVGLVYVAYQMIITIHIGKSTSWYFDSACLKTKHWQHMSPITHSHVQSIVSWVVAIVPIQIIVATFHTIEDLLWIYLARSVLKILRYKLGERN